MDDKIIAYIKKNDPNYFFKFDDFTYKKNEFKQWKLNFKQPDIKDLEAITQDEIDELVYFKNKKHECAACKCEHIVHIEKQIAVLEARLNALSIV